MYGENDNVAPLLLVVCGGLPSATSRHVHELVAEQQQRNRYCVGDEHKQPVRPYGSQKIAQPVARRPGTASDLGCHRCSSAWVIDNHLASQKTQGGGQSRAHASAI